MNDSIIFTVPGQPVGKARHRSAPLMRGGKPVIGKGGRPVVIQHSDEKTANFEGLVAHGAQVAMRGRALVTGPVAVELDIRLQIPASWSKKRKGLAVAGRVGATKKPDIDNVEKAIFDGMNGVVWADDVQVVQVTKRKRYAETPGVVVIVRKLEMEAA